MQLVDLNNGIYIHTKIDKKVKRTIEAMSKRTDVDQSIIINSILAKALRPQTRRTRRQRK